MNKRWALLAAMLWLGSAHAATKDDELLAGVCIIANQGIYNAASARQSGLSKKEATVAMQKQLSELKKSFRQEQFLAMIGRTWSAALERLYETPVLPTQKERDAFVKDTTEQALLSCMASGFGKKTIAK